ncbi:MAG: hypothetical protein EA398_10925 [Deltaproteobacteria bacterium]|nr:MAG: hypothetical protein EA398_10925 [Deltaproteobacteria bacterium]
MRRHPSLSHGEAFSLRLVLGLAQDLSAHDDLEPMALAPDVLHVLADHMLRHTPMTGDRMLAIGRRIERGGEVSRSLTLDRLHRRLPSVEGVSPSIVLRLLADPDNLRAIGMRMKEIESGGEDRVDERAVRMWH